MMDFRINDSTYNGDESPTLKKMIELLSNMTDGDIWFRQRFIEESGFSASKLDAHLKHPAIQKYKTTENYEGVFRCLFANEKTMEAWKNRPKKGGE